MATIMESLAHTTGSMIGGHLLVWAARGLGSRLKLSAVAGLLVLAAMVALPLGTLAQTPGAPPESPQNLSGSVLHDSVSLSWDDPSDSSITGYQILRRDRAIHEAGEFHPIVDDTGSSGTAYVDFTVEAGTEYVYRAKARNAAGLSSWSGLLRVDTTSGPIQGVPAKPSPPTVTEVAHDTVTISWTAPGDSSITGYQVLRRKRGEDGRGVFELVEDDTGSTTTSYTDSSVVASTEYGYRLRARNAQGLSERSASVGVETSAAPEPTPTYTPEPTPEQTPAEHEQADVPTWSAEVTVGAYNRPSPPMIGYSTWSQTGAVSDRDFEMDGTTYRVLALIEQAGGLYLATTPALPVEFTLATGDQEFAASDSSVPATAGAGRYWWQTDTELFAVGETVSVSITAAEDTEASANRPLAPPTAYFSDIPASHNGADEFTLRVSFSEEVSLTATTLQEHALVATGATVTAVAQRTANSTRNWNVTVQPGGTADITLGLAATTACDQSGAVCTSDGHLLHNQPHVVVPGHAIAQLSDLAVAGLSLSPAFSPAETLYTAQASTGLIEVTVTAIVPRDDITVEIAPEDADTTKTGHQVTLEPRVPTTVTVSVTASDGNASRLYQVTVTREAVTCFNPTPTEVPFSALPIVVNSTTDDYFVLYVNHDVDGTVQEMPVLVKRGEAGTTTLAENAPARPVERYRVERYQVADPADVDGDCVDDLTELAALGAMNPVNPAATVAPEAGVLAFVTALSGYTKFVMYDLNLPIRPSLVFQNRTNYPGHDEFMRQILGIEPFTAGTLRGNISYNPTLASPDGSPGAYVFWLSGYEHDCSYIDRPTPCSSPACRCSRKTSSIGYRRTTFASTGVARRCSAGRASPSPRTSGVGPATPPSTRQPVSACSAREMRTSALTPGRS